jgi:outer membrane protein assembly factor BamB
MKSVVASLAVVVFYVAFSLTLVGQTAPSQWTQLRGNSGTGIGPVNAQPAIKIDLKSQTVWRTEIAGTGWSSPVYEGDLIWLTTSIATAADPEEIKRKLEGKEFAKMKTLAKSVELRAIAIDRSSGKLVHNRLLHTVVEPEPTHPMNSHASPTAAISKGNVVCHFGSYGTWCLDSDSAETIWQTQYVVDHSVGPGSSPTIVDGKVILVCDGTDKQFIAAVDLRTGEEVWKTNRPPINAQSGEFEKAYSTPLLIKIAGKPQLVIPGAGWIAAYQPDSGKEIWRARHGDGFSVTPMASYESGVIVFSTGYAQQTQLVAVDPTGTGDVTDSHIKWRARQVAPTMPSLIATDGRVYSLSDKGFLACLDIETGKTLNRIRIGGNFSSSPLLAGGNLYLSDRKGLMTVVKCDEELKRVAKNQFDGSIMASPVLDGDDLLVRTEKALLRIRR